MDRKPSTTGPPLPLSRRVVELASPSSMNTPASPSRHNAEIAERIRSINQQWSLAIPETRATESPSKRPSPDEWENARALIAFFVFQQHRGFLDTAIANFNTHACNIHAEWTFKPGADIDLTPRRRLSALPGFAGRNLSSAMGEKLLQTLNRFLREEKGKAVKETPRSRSATVEPEPRAPIMLEAEKKLGQSASRKPTQGPRAQASISNYFVKKKSPPANLGSTEITMEDAEEDMLRRDMKVADDAFTTPPQSAHGEKNVSAHTWLKEKPDIVGVKRQLSQPDEAPPRKNPRASATEAQIPYRVNHYETGAKPQLGQAIGNSFTSLQQTSAVNSASTSFSNGRTTTSNLSFRTEGTSASLLDVPRDSFCQAEARSFTTCTGVVENCGERMDVDKTAAEYENGDALRMIVDQPAWDYFQGNLFTKSPFRELLSFKNILPSFRVAYEVTRVALHTGVPAQNLLERLASNGEHLSPEYGKMWSTLTGYVHNHKKMMPERSPASAWEAADKSFKHASLTGLLKFNTTHKESLFELQLNPLRTESSFRFKRRYGGHRFLQIGLPGIEPRDLPSFLKGHEELARSKILEWILDRVHHLLGRQWRVFFSKAWAVSSASRKGSKFAFNEPRTKLYFFAERGHGFSSAPAGAQHEISDVTNPPVCTVEKMVGWYVDVKKHGSESSLKLYSRLALGVSPTVPTVQFAWRQIVRSDDAFSSCPAQRTLNVRRSEQKKAGKGNGDRPSSGDAVMNDGCARISQKAARHVADMLGMQNQPTPSAFQGRLGGAKGVWFPDPLGEVLGKDEEEWIEVTDSQLKFDWHLEDAWHADKNRLTFEVSSWSLPLRSAALNFQLFPLLVNRGISPSYIEQYLEADVTARAARAEAAKDSARALGCWNQAQSPALSRRKKDGSIEWQGGAPRNPADQIALMVASGFCPLENHHLYQLMYRSVSSYFTQVLERMSIPVSCSCYALCIADPLAILNEDEVHFGFSQSFNGEVRVRGKQDEDWRPWSNTLLHDQDVLVTRSPQHLISDVQRVRAVFKPELAIFKDVIVFPSKGKQALADKLSGGDYDGDRMLVCWDPGLVDVFRNFELPAPTTPEHYGIVINNTKVCDLGDNATSKMLRNGLEAALRPPMLGAVVNYLERLNYHRWTTKGAQAMQLPDTLEIGQLASFLVDAPKAGFYYDDSTFQTYVKGKGLRTDYANPCYRDGRVPKRIIHPIDQAKAKGKEVRDKVLGNLTKIGRTVDSYDPILAKLYHEEKELAMKEPALEPVLEDLKTKLEEIGAFWSEHAKHQDDQEEAREGAMSFATVVEQARQKFENVAPLAVVHPTAARWAREHATAPLSLKSTWLQLKASTLYFTFQQRPMPWHVAMNELCALKALASPHASVVVREIGDVTKIDQKMVRRLDALDEVQMATFQQAVEDDCLEGGLADDEFIEAFDYFNLGGPDD